MKIKQISDIINSITLAFLGEQFKTIVEVSEAEIDWSLGQIFTKTLDGDTDLSFVNIHIGVKDIEISGDFALTLPSWLRIIDGTYDGTVLNYIQVVCTNAGSGTENGWCVISQEA